MTPEECSASSLAAGEQLAGTATLASRWLLVEARGAWARDVEETELPAETRALVDAFEGRAQLIRRPDRREGQQLMFLAESDEDGGTLGRVPSPEHVDAAEPIGGSLLLVCCHGRRDPCCARFGTQVYDALRTHFPAEAVWQSSHLGGHRFAANVLVLPAGVLLGRVRPEDARAVAAEIAAGRIPLDHYRGKTIHPPEAQAADAAVRDDLGLTGFADVSLLAATGGRVRLATPQGELDVAVEANPGPPLRDSCGKDPAASTRYKVRW